MSTLKEIADQLVENCRTGKELDGLAQLYAPDAISVEAMGQGGQSPVTVGVEAIKGKHHWFAENFTVHSGKVEGPFPHGDDRFAVIFELDATMKPTGVRSVMREVAVYHVKDSKIVREEFFYGA